MTTEFNLSEKIDETIDYSVIMTDDVKEFIKILKEEFGDYFFRDDMPNRYKDAIKIIDKLAGDKLT